MNTIIDLSPYLGKFVARRGKKVIAIADTMEELLRELREAGIDIRKVVIDYVPEEPVFMIPGTVAWTPGRNCSPTDRFSTRLMYKTRSFSTEPYI